MWRRAGEKNTRNQFGDSRSIISPRNQASSSQFQKCYFQKVSTVLKLLSQSVVESRKVEGVVGFILVNTMPLLETSQVSRHTHRHSSSFLITKQRFDQADFTARKNNFSILEWLQLWWLMFINSVHYLGIHLSPDEDVCVSVWEFVCMCASPLKFPVQAAVQ